MKSWFSVKELTEARLPGLPVDAKNFDRFIMREGWRADPDTYRKMQGREGGGGYEYHVSLLPQEARQKLAFMEGAQTSRTDASKHLWAVFEALTSGQKAECKRRLDVLL